MHATMRKSFSVLRKWMSVRFGCGLPNIVAKDGSIKLAVSCLKIKPKVLIFPSESSRVSAAFTHATIGSLSPFFRMGMGVRLE